VKWTALALTAVAVILRGWPTNTFQQRDDPAPDEPSMVDQVVSVFGYQPSSPFKRDDEYEWERGRGHP
jgi:hypothetical protein